MKKERGKRQPFLTTIAPCEQSKQSMTILPFTGVMAENVTGLRAVTSHPTSQEFEEHFHRFQLCHTSVLYEAGRLSAHGS